MTVHFVPVFAEVSEGVTHRVGILAGEHRSAVGGVAGDGEQPFPARVLRSFHVVVGHAGVEVFVLRARIEARDDVDILRVGRERVGGGTILSLDVVVGETVGLDALGPLVVHEARGVVLVDPCCGDGEVGSPSGFVAEAPEDDRRVVAVADHHALCAVHPGGRPRRVAGQLSAQSVLFDVGFVHDVESERVAELVPPLAVRIVARSHGVDVAALHEQDVLQHALLGHDMPRLGIHLVTVHAAQAHLLAVDEQHAVADFQLAEPHLRVGLFDDGALCVAQCQSQGI